MRGYRADDPFRRDACVADAADGRGRDVAAAPRAYDDVGWQDALRRGRRRRTKLFQRRLRTRYPYVPSPSDVSTILKGAASPSQLPTAGANPA